jgi:hypothetical protein
MSNNNSFITNDTADLIVPIVTEIDLDFNLSKVLEIVAYVYPSQEDIGAECRIEFQEVIDKLINYYETAEDRDNLNPIYSIAHELARQSERLRDVAFKLEESQENYLPPLVEEDDVDGNSYDMEEK